MTEWEKAEAGFLYDAHMDENIVQGRRRSQELNYDYNALRPCQFEERDKMIRDNFRKVGKHCVIEQPFHGDFWERISVGDNFFANYNFVALAGNYIDIGDNVWIGGGTKIMGGISIGDNTVIAAGSIVAKSIPANVLAGGNPCKVIREIGPEDDGKYKSGFLGF